MAFFKKIFSILADSLAKTLGHGFDFQTCPKHANLRRSIFRKWMIQNSGQNNKNTNSGGK